MGTNNSCDYDPTQYNVQSGGASGTLNNIAPGSTSGVPLISQGASSQPVFGTAVVAGGGTGNTSQAAYSLVCGGTTTTGPFQSVADVATGQVLISGGTAALPLFSAYPQITGLGIGASPGSTAGLTFDGSNFMANYSVGSWTPTYTGATTPGTTTYTVQFGYYVRTGAVVTVQFDVEGTGATGTGNIVIGGFPFTIKNQTSGRPVGSIIVLDAMTWPTGTTCCSLMGTINTTQANISCQGTGTASASLQIANAAFAFRGSLTYEI